MEKHYLDTNYFLRLILSDNKEQSKKARQLLMEGEKGKISLYTTSIVLFEISWVLKSFYEQSKAVIHKTLTNILNLNFINIPDKETVTKALNIYQTSNLSLEDSYHLAFCLINKLNHIATFDKDLRRKFIRLAHA